MKKLGVAACALLFVLAGCGGSDPADEVAKNNELVCDEFAAHAKAGLPEDSRSDVVESIGEIIDLADPKLKDAYEGLQRQVGGSDSGYQQAADVFAETCFDLGWEG